MKITSIIEECVQTLGTSVQTVAEDTELLLKSANAVIEELTLASVNLKSRAKVVASGNKIYYTALQKKVRDITGIYYPNGEKAEYVRYPDHIRTTKDGVFEVFFCYYLSELNAEEEFCLPPEISLGTLCNGTLAEYYYRRGLLDEAIYYRNRFDRMVHSSSRARGSKTVAARRFI